jgi:hypothetical protein
MKLTVAKSESAVSNSRLSVAKLQDNVSHLHDWSAKMKHMKITDKSYSAHTSRNAGQF